MFAAIYVINQSRQILNSAKDSCIVKPVSKISVQSADKYLKIGDNSNSIYLKNLKTNKSLPIHYLKLSNFNNNRPP